VAALAKLSTCAALLPSVRVCSELLHFSFIRACLSRARSLVRVASCLHRPCAVAANPASAHARLHVVVLLGHLSWRMAPARTAYVALTSSLCTASPSPRHCRTRGPRSCRAVPVCAATSRQYLHTAAPLRPSHSRARQPRLQRPPRALRTSVTLEPSSLRSLLCASASPPAALGA
jgi:hypothetical protein